MKFRAAILKNINEPLLIDEIENDLLFEGQVLIKILQTGVCRSQLFEMEGQRGLDKYLPHLLGHEAIGIVKDLGDKVTKVKEGDYVVLSWIKSKGISAKPAKYFWKDKIVNSGQVTTFSEYSVCSENRCLKIDKELAYKIGPTLGCALPTGYGLSLTQPEFKTAKYLGVVGLGGIGMAALLGALDQSNAEIFAIDVNQNRLKEAKLLGAKYIFNPLESSINVADFLREKTNNKMLDLLLECSGSINVLNNSLKLINDLGLVKFVSHPKFGDLLNIDPFELILGKRIEGSWGGGTDPDKDFELIAKKICCNKIFLKLYSNKYYELEAINSALHELKSGKVLRPIINLTK